MNYETQQSHHCFISIIYDIVSIRKTHKTNNQQKDNGMSTIGLDFGTTNSALAVMEGETVRVVNIDNMDPGKSTMRSVLFFEKNKNPLAGQLAIHHYVQSRARDGRFLQSLKAFLAEPSFTGTSIFGKRLDIEDLVALILREIKTTAENNLGYQVNQVVMGRPVYFSDDPQNDKLAENRLKTAAQRAGFKSVIFEFEPIAATLAFLKQMGTTTEQTVLMGDFGGGTSDFTVMQLRADMLHTQEEKRKRVLAMGGVYIGGDTFDSRIMREKLTPHFGSKVLWTGQSLPMPLWIMHTLCEWHMIPFLKDQKTLELLRQMKRATGTPRPVENLEYLIMENRGFHIFQAIEKAKTELSVRQEARIVYNDKKLQIDEPISRSEFGNFIAGDMEKISSCVKQTLSAAAVRAEEVDKVLLTGGSSFVPAVRQFFADTFGENKIVNLDAFTSVAHGLALSASFK